MKVLCLDRPLRGSTPEKYQPHLLDEVRHAWESYKRGVVRDIYFRQDRPGVAMFLECENPAEAQELLASFPLVKAGLIDFEMIPLGPFTNWEVLFAQSGK